VDVVLRPISPAAAEAIRGGRAPAGVRVAADYPTEFSAEVGEQGPGDAALGPFFVHRADDGVRALLERVRGAADVDRIVALTPLDRPASGRVLEKAGFRLAGELDHEHDGEPMRVKRWELTV